MVAECHVENKQPVITDRIEANGAMVWNAPKEWLERNGYQQNKDLCPDDEKICEVEFIDDKPWIVITINGLEFKYEILENGNVKFEGSEIQSDLLLKDIDPDYEVGSLKKELPLTDEEIKTILYKTISIFGYVFIGGICIGTLGLLLSQINLITNNDDNDEPLLTLRPNTNNSVHNNGLLKSETKTDNGDIVARIDTMNTIIATPWVDDVADALRLVLEFDDDDNLKDIIDL